MTGIPDNEFAWSFFEKTGNIEGYLLYKEYNNLNLGKKTDEYNSDYGVGAENL